MRKGFLVVISVIVLLVGLNMTVKSQERSHVKVDEKAYHQLEKEYVKQIRNYLNTNGYKNCGVTMTKVYEEDGSHSYKVELHHRYFDSMSSCEQAELFENLEQIMFPIQDDTVCYTFV